MITFRSTEQQIRTRSFFRWLQENSSGCKNSRTVNTLHEMLSNLRKDPPYDWDLLQWTLVGSLIFLIFLTSIVVCALCGCRCPSFSCCGVSRNLDGDSKCIRAKRGRRVMACDESGNSKGKALLDDNNIEMNSSAK